MSVTATHIATRLRELVDAAEERAAEAADAADRLGQAKHAYKVAHAQALTAAMLGGASGIKAKAMADRDTGKELEAFTIAEAMAKVTLETTRIAREAISAGQTSAGWFRLEWEAAHKGPQVRT